MAKDQKRARKHKKAEPVFLVSPEEVRLLTPRFDPALFGRRTKRIFGVDAYSLSETELLDFLQEHRLCVNSMRPNVGENETWVYLESEPTGLPDRVRAHIKKTVEPPVLIQPEGRFGGQQYPVFAYIAQQILGPVIKRQINIAVPHHIVSGYEAEGPFRILVWSTPHDARKLDRTPNTIWGIRVSCTDMPFQPNVTEGVLLTDGTYAVAELLPNALYIHHDIVHRGDINEFVLFAEIMARAAQIMADPARWAALVEANREAAKKRAQTAWADMVRRAAEMRHERRSGELEVAREEARELARKYFEAERTVLALELDALDTTESAERFMAEFEKLKSGKVEGIETITFDPLWPHYLTVHTKEIVAVHPDDPADRRVIGHCDCRYNLETGEVRIQNRDRTVPLYEGADEVAHTPHVFYKKGNDVCLGNIGTELKAYIARFEIEAAAVLTVGFLQSVTNNENYLWRFRQFPRYEDLYPKTAKGGKQ